MTEPEWLSCTDPTPMIEFLADRLSARKARLWSCACVRRAWRFLTDPRSRKAVQAAERFADGRIGARALWNAHCRADDVADESEIEWMSIHWDDIQHAACWTASDDILDMARSIAVVVAANVGLDPSSGIISLDLPEEKQEKAAQADLLRDLIGNPFRGVSVEPGWLGWDGGIVVKLAQAIYEERAFERMPVLADALEEAGCTDTDILDHLRHPGPHARGCWALDLVLRKE
jgi:hypothetical protein